VVNNFIFEGQPELRLRQTIQYIHDKNWIEQSSQDIQNKNTRVFSDKRKHRIYLPYSSGLCDFAITLKHTIVQLSQCENRGYRDILKDILDIEIEKKEEE